MAAPFTLTSPISQEGETMASTASADGRDPSCDLLYLATPALWPHWPFLPVVRHRPGREEEHGLLCDVLGLTGAAGASATVFFCNLFLLPPGLEDFLTLPREVFDTPEEVYAAGWRVDVRRFA
jgi:hypothetical protein